MLPGLLHGQSARCARTTTARPALRRELPRGRSARTARAFALLPTELYVRDHAKRRTRRRDHAGAGLVALAATGAAPARRSACWCSRRVLDSPGSTGARRAVAMREPWGRRAARPVDGRVRRRARAPAPRAAHAARPLDPDLPVLMVGDLRVRDAQADGWPRHRLVLPSRADSSLAAFGSFVCLMSILPIAMNQFAVDGRA